MLLDFNSGLQGTFGVAAEASGVIKNKLATIAAANNTRTLYIRVAMFTRLLLVLPIAKMPTAPNRPKTLLLT